jgi:hypothetical protein
MVRVRNPDKGAAGMGAERHKVTRWGRGWTYSSRARVPVRARVVGDRAGTGRERRGSWRDLAAIFGDPVRVPFRTLPVP